MVDPLWQGGQGFGIVNSWRPRLYTIQGKISPQRSDAGKTQVLQTVKPDKSNIYLLVPWVVVLHGPNSLLEDIFFYVPVVICSPFICTCRSRRSAHDPGRRCAICTFKSIGIAF
jgi:hypothetical protein